MKMYEAVYRLALSLTSNSRERWEDNMAAPFEVMSLRGKIETMAELLGVDPLWARAICFVESSDGKQQCSPTGAKGAFQLTSIAMKDLLQEMEKKNSDVVDVIVGVLFLYQLYNRHKTIEKATEHYCDPKDRDFYIKRVKARMEQLAKGEA